MAVKEIAAKVGNVFNSLAAVLLGFLQRIEDEAVADPPRVNATPFARHLRAGLNIAQKDGVLRGPNHLHPAGWRAIWVVERDFPHRCFEQKV